MAGDAVPLPSDRRRFLDERREICRQRFDTMHAPVCDDRWGGYVNPTHDTCVRTHVASLPAGARVLALQDLAAAGLTGFDAVLCIDAIENLGSAAGAYHYYPSVADAVMVLREGGFRVDELLESDGYAHVLLSA